MNFITSYYWQKEGGCKNTTALLLQQVLCKKGEFGIVFACVCAGKTVCEEAGILNAYITEQLQNWFYEKELMNSNGKKKRRLDLLSEELKVLLFRLDKELHYKDKINICGFLCVDERVLLFGRGTVRLWMLNKRFGRGNIKCLLDKQEELSLQIVRIQKNVGLFIATDDLYNRFDQNNIADGLNMWGIVSQKKADKHISELCIAAEKSGGNNVGAILLYAI